MQDDQAGQARGPGRHTTAGDGAGDGDGDASDRHGTGDGRRETPVERADRNWNEILQELRVTQTGIQILTGFLLTVPFQSRFTELTAAQRQIYLVLVALAATTTALLVAPVSLHRILFRKRAKDLLVSGADRIMRVGLVFLGLTVTGVVLLVFDVVAGRGLALVAAGAFLLMVIGAWFVLPRVTAARVDRRNDSRHGRGRPRTTPG